MDEQRYRVYNKCHYDIGFHLLNGQEMLIRAGNFQILSADDILYLENDSKIFSKEEFVVTDQNNKEVNLETIGVYEDPNVKKHITDEEITSMLKSTAKKIEAWIKDIDDIVDLEHIADIASTMDLPQSKMRIISEKLPNQDFSV